MEFWADRPEVLIQGVHELIPTNSMSVSEKLNAVFRFAIAFGIILSVYFNAVRYLYIPVIVAAITYAIDRHSITVRKETFDQQLKCRKPTQNNPFMNPLIGDSPMGPPCDQRNPEIKEMMKHHFENGLYQDVDAVWDRENSQRQFYTIPGATNPPDRKAFLDWLYNTEYVCKQDPGACLKNLPPRTIMR